MFKNKYRMLPIRFFNEPDGGTGGAPVDTPPAPSTDPAPKPGPPTPKAQATTQEPENATEPKEGDVDALPKWARDAITRANSQAADARVKAKTAQEEIVQNIGKALGLIKDENDKPTVESLTASLTESQNAAKESALQLAVYLASEGKANGAMLIDSQSFMKSLADIDPTDTAAIGTKVTEFITANPIFSKTPQAGASTADATGSAVSPVSPEQFAAMSTQQRLALARTDRPTFDRLTRQNG